MPDCRRYRVADGTYFFTVNLAERKQTIQVDHGCSASGDEKGDGHAFMSN